MSADTPKLKRYSIERPGKLFANSPGAWVKYADAQARIEALEAELAAQRVNAERYLWLREQTWHSSSIACVMNPKTAIRLGHDCPSLDRLDDIVDRGRAAKP